MHIVPCWCYCAGLACTYQTSTIIKNLRDLARRRCGTPWWRPENVETCSSIEYIQRHCCYIHFCDIHCAFVGYNKNNCPGISATRITIVQSNSKYKTSLVKVALNLLNAKLEVWTILMGYIITYSIQKSEIKLRRPLPDTDGFQIQTLPDLRNFKSRTFLKRGKKLK
jgi:hypothetical protein